MLQLKQEKSPVTPTPEISIIETDFSDDLVVRSDTLEQVQLFLLRLKSTAAQFSLLITENKTEFILNRR